MTKEKTKTDQSAVGIRAMIRDGTAHTFCAGCAGKVRWLFGIVDLIKYKEAREKKIRCDKCSKLLA